MGRSITEGGDSGAVAEVPPLSLSIAWEPLEFEGSSERFKTK